MNDCCGLELFSQRTITLLQKLNEKIEDTIQGPIKTLLSVGVVENENRNTQWYPVEFLNTIDTENVLSDRSTVEDQNRVYCHAP